MRSIFSLSLFAGLTCFAMPMAWAACTNPNGEPGDAVYAGNYGTLAYCNGTNWVSTAGGPVVNVGGNTNNPGGADTYIQFNSGGTSFGGSAGLTWNNSTNTLTATNIGATAVTATTIGGTLSTAAQPNITTVGTLTGLTMGGHISAVGYNVSATNVYASSVSGSSGTFGSLTVNGVPVTGNAQGDRISTSGVVSGVTLGMAVADKGTVSFTLGGTAGAAYLHPTLGLVGPGVSTTGPVSAASVYTPGKVSASSVNTIIAHFGGQAVGNLLGAGGNFITSGTTQVSASADGSIKVASAGTLAMTISGSNVGIGTDTPAEKLHVSGGALRISQASAGSVYGLQLWPSDGSGNAAAIGRENGATGALILRNQGADTLAIKSGNVGIGTTSPGAPLSFGTSPKEFVRFYDPGTAAESIGVGIASNDFQSFVGGISNNFTWRQGGYGGTTLMILLGSGKVGIGTTNPTHLLQLNTDDGYKPNGGSWGNSSDERLKTNIRPVQGALDTIAKLNPVLFDWRNPALHGGKAASGGFIAQQVKQVFPDWVSQSDCAGDDCKLTKGENAYGLQLPFTFDAYLVKGIQELKADNDNLREQVELLRREVEGLKAARH